jgi:galactose-1-phosphate uridylyltransferase
MGADNRASAGKNTPAPDAECPLCSSRPRRPTEIPAAWYQVAVFQNRFPALAQDLGHEMQDRSEMLRGMPGNGRCEVVVFSPEHDTSFADLSLAQAATVMDAWKLKYLAGTESGMGAFTNDIVPEDAARRLRELA